MHPLDVEHSEAHAQGALPFNCGVVHSRSHEHVNRAVHVTFTTAVPTVLVRDETVEVFLFFFVLFFFFFEAALHIEHVHTTRADGPCLHVVFLLVRLVLRHERARAPPAALELLPRVRRLLTVRVVQGEFLRTQLEARGDEGALERAMDGEKSSTLAVFEIREVGHEETRGGG